MFAIARYWTSDFHASRLYTGLCAYRHPQILAQRIIRSHRMIFCCLVRALSTTKVSTWPVI